MEHILVVDDEPAIVTVVRDRLEREGFAVQAVASGEEALTHMDANPVDLMVLDVMLPGIDGFEVLRRLRGSGCAVPVIMLTARDEDLDKIVGLELGADDYMIKPFNIHPRQRTFSGLAPEYSVGSYPGRYGGILADQCAPGTPVEPSHPGYGASDPPHRHRRHGRSYQRLPTR